MRSDRRLLSKKGAGRWNKGLASVRSVFLFNCQTCHRTFILNLPGLDPISAELDTLAAALQQRNLIRHIPNPPTDTPLKAKIWLARTNLYVVSKLFRRCLRFSVPALHIWTTHCRAAERNCFHSPHASFCDACSSPTGHVSITGTQWRLIYFLCALYFVTPLDQIHSRILASRYNPIYLLLDLDSSFLSLSLSLSLGWKQKIVLDVSHCSYRKWSSACINPSMIQVGGWGGGGGVLNWAFSAKLSTQNKQIIMSAFCTGGKPAHRCCCCLVLKHHPECSTLGHHFHCYSSNVIKATRTREYQLDISTITRQSHV